MKDLIKDTDGDVTIMADDLFIGTSDQQHQQDLIMTEKGAIKQFLDVGVGAVKYLEAEDPGDLLREISLQFTADGMQVDEVKILDDGRISVISNYESS